MGSPRHLVVRSTWGHLTTEWRDFCYIQLSLLGSQTCYNIEYLLVYRWQNFTPRWSVSPLGGDFHLPEVRFSFLSLRMEEFAYILVAGGDPMIQSPPRELQAALRPAGQDRPLSCRRSTGVHEISATQQKRKTDTELLLRGRVGQG